MDLRKDSPGKTTPYDRVRHSLDEVEEVEE